MVKLDYLLEVDNHWIKIKKWWDNIKLSNKLLPKEIKKVNFEEKNIFKINFLYIIKKIFDIEDLTNIDKININNYDIHKLINNFKLNIDIFKKFINEDNELKNIICYFLSFHDYFNFCLQRIW